MAIKIIRPQAPQPVPAPTQPLPASSKAKLANLTGNVRTLRPNSGQPYGIPWANVVRYAESYEKYAKQYSLPPFLNAAVGVVESDSTHRRDGVVIERWDNYPQDGPSVGVMQIKPKVNQHYAPQADAYTEDGNIQLASAMIGSLIERYGSWQAGMIHPVYGYFPDNDPNGTTQNKYILAITSLMSEMANQLQDGGNPNPTPPPDTDPYGVIFGGKPYRMEYGFRADVGLNYYSYGVNHGTTASTQHTGDDVLVPDETKLYAPFDGIVTCVGWVGEVTWGQGCGYFEDTTPNSTGHDTNVGNISIRGTGKAEGVKLVLGHSSAAEVKYGQKVKAGDLVGYSGGMNGPHTHVEMAIPRNGTYWLVDPKPALVLAMGGQAPVAYAERQPFVLSEDNPEVWVEATMDGVPVLQYANPEAKPVRAPLKKGERFEAGTQVMGTDKLWWWLTSIGSRIPTAGTRVV